MESAFCGASSDVTNPDNGSGGIDEHAINAGFDGDFFDNGSGSWDTNPTKN